MSTWCNKCGMHNVIGYDPRGSPIIGELYTCPQCSSKCCFLCKNSYSLDQCDYRMNIYYGATYCQKCVEEDNPVITRRPAPPKKYMVLSDMLNDIVKEPHYTLRSLMLEFHDYYSDGNYIFEESNKKKRKKLMELFGKKIMTTEEVSDILKKHIYFTL